MMMMIIIINKRGEQRAASGGMVISFHQSEHKAANETDMGIEPFFHEENSFMAH